MKMLRSKCNYMKENIKLYFFFNIATFLLLSWICQSYNEVSIPAKNIEWKYNPDGELNINFKRLLAKAKIEKKVEQKALNVKDSVHWMNKEKKNEKKDVPVYDKIKKEKKNDLDYYMKSYKDRYAKRIGLGKFDCYCENKIFRGIDEMNKLANTPNMTKGKFKKEMRKRYGMRIGLTYFFYFLTVVVGILDIINTKTSLQFYNADKLEGFKEVAKKLIPSLGDLLVYVIPFILTLTIIYILIKIVKYERLKSCKSKMSAMEYFGLCKDIF